MEHVCKYFQCGFCKFGESCRKQHIKEICQTQSCTLSSCIKRHPKVCKYFSVQKGCKFGELCSYKHIPNSNQNEVVELKEKMVTLERSLQLMTAKISELTEEVTNIKRGNPQKSREKPHTCSHCSYTASTSTVLKRHVAMKHKNPENVKIISCKECGIELPSHTDLDQHHILKHTNKTPSKEVERKESLDDSLVLSLDHEERSDDGFNSSPSNINQLSPTADPCPSSPVPTETLFEKCAFINCSDQATQFFSSTKIDNVRYKDLLICKPCTRFIHLKELKANPPVLFP